ncbi:hypothetical protein AMELA_G00168090 [Ameiurus melas]|uniref:Uncharacterized protein n=1 Tax=Ameiurus melas TaxID=219545 RepID=A0A7J6ABR1_AMEME|nr:hypothetical protein AMELA_G00168090 [Ameiurus melas]
MDQDERRRKLEAGRAKLAQFRQQRAKGNSANAAKKTTKRKSQTVQTNDRSDEREESQPEHTYGQDGKEELEESEQPHDTGIPEQSSLPVDGTAADQSDEQEELLGAIVVSHTSKEQLKQLQAAVEKRNEIISQLSINLQAALLSREQVQLEAQQLTGQIQALQQQLQQAKEYLRSKSVGWLDLSQTQQTHRQLLIEPSLQTDNYRQVLLAQKETEITAFQKKLTVMEDSLSQFQSAFTANNMEQVKSSLCHNAEILSGINTSPENNLDSSSDLILRLKCELDQERQNSKRVQEHAESLQEMVLKFESEKCEMEARLQSVQDDLESALKQAREAQQYKSDKERLNQDVARLDGLVQELQNRLQEEEETSKHLHYKYEAEIANSELRLQTMEEERVLNLAQLGEAHEAALKRLQEGHSEEVRRIQELLDQAQKHNLYGASSELDTNVTWIQTSEEQHNQETATEGSSEVVPSMNASVTDDLMERYLASAVQCQSSWMEQSLEEHISEVYCLQFGD